ncbi:MAG: protein-S-isoprenylcysteine O-methyltransferase-like protein [Candidatus Saganbacteria bacterium]|uniref:Protein-S-isoprenylcysteine O-methyltransferase-like protein n=1 Tax=Candidatus Saganbacteria bacterium TaxID=2575572 RepID=A0A833L008_UNCSA|nr:MAG: protein-S-isoprenylcysteine O-methyltransferase-like protein [Candidatus Saganbacteria bacterium]
MTKTILIYFLSLIFFLVILPAITVASGLFLNKLLNLPQIVYLPYNWSLALIFIAFGAFWMGWSFYVLIKTGQGNPQEAFGKEILPAPKKLVTIGPYRYTRNPMGFGWFIIVAGIGIYLGSISVILIILPIVLMAVIFYLKYFEGKNLIKRFGDDYLRYRENVPLFIPGFVKKRHHDKN